MCSTTSSASADAANTRDCRIVLQQDLVPNVVRCCQVLSGAVWHILVGRLLLLASTVYLTRRCLCARLGVQLRGPALPQRTPA